MCHGLWGLQDNPKPHRHSGQVDEAGQKARRVSILCGKCGAPLFSGCDISSFRLLVGEELHKGPSQRLSLYIDLLVLSCLLLCYRSSRF